MAEPLLSVLLYLFTIAESTTTSTFSSQLHRLKALRGSVYRDTLTNILVRGCNDNRELMFQTDDEGPLAVFENEFSYYPLPASIAIADYLSTIHVSFVMARQPIKDEIFVIVYIYMKRLMNRSGLKATYWNIHRMLGLATWMACKVHYDAHYNLLKFAWDPFGIDPKGTISKRFIFHNQQITRNNIC